MKPLAERFAPERLGRSFRWLLGSTWVTNLADGITLAAGPLLVASQTRNPLAVAMAAFLQRLPWLLFGLYAGVVADRAHRRAIVATTGVVRILILAVLIMSIVVHRVDIALVLIALFLFGVNEAFGETASATLLPMLVAPRDLGLANARALTGVIVWNRLAGPPVGAALFAAGRALPFVGETVCVLAGVLLLLRVRLPPPAPRARAARVRDEIRDGWRWLWAHPAVRTLAVTIFTFNVTYGAAWSVLVLYARERLGMNELGFGLITTAMAVGGLIGTASYGWLERRIPLGVIMRGGLIIETLTTWPWPWTAGSGWPCSSSRSSAPTPSSGARPPPASASARCPPNSRAGSAASTSPAWSAASSSARPSAGWSPPGGASPPPSGSPSPAPPSSWSSSGAPCSRSPTPTRAPAPARPSLHRLTVRACSASRTSVATTSAAGGRSLIRSTASPARRLWQQLTAGHPVPVGLPGLGVPSQLILSVSPLVEERMGQRPARVPPRPARAVSMSSTLLRSVSSPRPSTIAFLIPGSTTASCVAWKRVRSAPRLAPSTRAAARPRPSAIPPAASTGTGATRSTMAARTAASTARPWPRAPQPRCPGPRPDRPPGPPPREPHPSW